MCYQVSTFRNLTLWNPQVGFTPWLGSASCWILNVVNVLCVVWNLNLFNVAQIVCVIWFEFYVKCKCIMLKPKCSYLLCILSCFRILSFGYDIILGFDEFNFYLFCKSFVVIDPFYKNVNFNSLNATKPLLSFNVIPNFNTFIYVGSVFWKGKEKIYEDIVACPCKNFIEPTINGLKWEINRFYQNKWVARFIWFEPIHGVVEKWRWWGARFAPRLRGKISY